MRLVRPLWTLACLLMLTVVCFAAPVEAAEKRIALVVGNAAYAAGALATPANDAGLVAQTLQAAGFDVIGARDLDEDNLRKALRDFVDKAAASGPDTVAVLYLAGYGLQLEGENYFAPIDLRVTTAADVGLRALRISDYAKSLAALPLKARFVILDGARRSPFTVPDKPLAGGLALTEAEPGSLIAFNAAPGTVGPDEKGPYGAYAQALVEMMREGGLKPGPLFERVRLRVDEVTKGAEVPWDSNRAGDGVVFFERAADAPPAGQPEKVAALRDRPLRDLGARDAYAVCLQRDDLAGYQEFVTDYPSDALTRRVRALIAARREALVWRRTWLVGTPDAYWSYLNRYPRGPHAWDARRRLASLAAAYDPPPRFATITYDVAPPPPEEIVYVDRPVLYLADPIYDLPPPPPPPVFFLPPPPAYLVALAPPPPVYGLYVLPSPPIVAVPAYVSAPTYVVPPPNNVIFENIHNTTVIEQINHQAIVSPTAAGIGGALAGAAIGATASRVALPAGLAARGGPNGGPTGGSLPPSSPSPGGVPSRAFGGGGPGVARLQSNPGAPVAPMPVQPGGMQRFTGQTRTDPAARPDPRTIGPRPFRQNAPAEVQRRQEMFGRRAIDRQAIGAQRQPPMQAGRQQAFEASRQRQMIQAQRAREMNLQRREMIMQRAAPMPHAPAFAGRPMIGQPHPGPAYGGRPMMGQPQPAPAFGGRPPMGQPHPAPMPAPRQAPPPPQHAGGHPPCRPGAPCH